MRKVIFWVLFLPICLTMLSLALFAWAFDIADEWAMRFERWCHPEHF
jgi:hypothetical protein